MHKTIRGKIILFCALMTVLFVIFIAYKSSQHNQMKLETNNLQGEINGSENLKDY